MPTPTEQRALVRAEVLRRMADPDAVERLTDLVCEWRTIALRQAALASRVPGAAPSPEVAPQKGA